MKIYFAGSIRGGRNDVDFYMQIIKTLTSYGQVLTEHIGNKDITEKGETVISDTDIYERDMAWIREADVIVADVSTPSTGVGYEIGYAESIGKKILCLYSENAEKRISGMINGNNKVVVKTYKTIEDVELILKEFFV